MRGAKLRRLLSLVLAAVLLLGAVVIPGAPTAKAAETPQYRNIMYYGDWSIYSGQKDFEPCDIDASYLTHLNLAFLDVDTNGDIILCDYYADFQKVLRDQTGKSDADPYTGVIGAMYNLRSKYPNLKIGISVGGWTRSGNFPVMANDPTARANFVSQICEFVHLIGYDFVDIDWEYPGADRDPDPDGNGVTLDRGCKGLGYETDGKNFTLLMQDLRAELNKWDAIDGKHYELSCAMGAAPAYMSCIDYTAVSEACDFINMMTYDLNGAWNNYTGHQTPLYTNENYDHTLNKDGNPIQGDGWYSIDNVIKFLREHYPDMDMSKVTVGVTAYTRGWGGVEKGTGRDPEAPGLYAKAQPSSILNESDTVKAGCWGYSSLPELMSRYSLKEYWDDTAKANYYYNEDGGYFFTCDTPRSIAEKGKYVQENGLGGLISWMSSNDRNMTITKAMKESLYGSASLPAQPIVTSKPEAHADLKQSEPGTYELTLVNDAVAKYTEPAHPVANEDKGGLYFAEQNNKSIIFPKLYIETSNGTSATALWNSGTVTMDGNVIVAQFDQWHNTIRPSGTAGTTPATIYIKLSDPNATITKITLTQRLMSSDTKDQEFGHTVIYGADAPVTTYNLTLNSTGVSPAPSLTGAGSYESGTSVAISAPSVTGYNFLGWYDGNTRLSTSNSYTYTVTGHKTLTAKYEKIPTVTKYNLTLKSEGATATLTGADSYDKDAVASYSASDVSGYKFLGWFNNSGGLVNPNKSGTVTMIGNITLTAKYEKEEVKATYTISASSAMQANDGSAAPGEITLSKTTVTEGDRVTATATATAGYNFVGWFAAAAQGTAYTGTPLSTSLSYTFKPTADTKLAAVYKVQTPVEPAEPEDVNITILGSNFTITVDGKTSAVQRSKATRKLPIGTEVTVDCVDDTFVNWQSELGMILSKQPSYTFTVLASATYTAVNKDTAPNTGLVEFVSDYNQVMACFTYTAEDEIEFPEGPVKIGFVFDGWDKTEAEIQALIASGEKHIVVSPKYHRDSSIVFDLTVYVDGVKSSELSKTDAAYARSFELEAPAVACKQFKCWATDAAGKNVLGYASTCYVKMLKDTTVYAVYTDAGETVERTPTISITPMTVVDGEQKVTTTIIRNVPEGYTMVEHGVLVNRDGSIQNPTSDSFVIGGANIIKGQVTNSAFVGADTPTISISNDHLNTTVFLRGYLVVRNQAGETEYYYTDIISGVYNKLLQGVEEPPITEPTEPEETDPIETDPIETDPIETDPIETDPIETDPPETDPIETDPPETDPPETDPPETDPEEPTEKAWRWVNRSSSWKPENGQKYILVKGNEDKAVTSNAATLSTSDVSISEGILTSSNYDAITFTFNGNYFCGNVGSLTYMLNPVYGYWYGLNGNPTYPTANGYTTISDGGWILSGSTLTGVSSSEAPSAANGFRIFAYVDGAGVPGGDPSTSEPTEPEPTTPAADPNSSAVVIGYYHNWDNGAGNPFIPLRDVDPAWDVINISFAVPTGGGGSTDGRMSFDPAQTWTRGNDTYHYTKEEFKQDVKDKQAAGKKVVLAIGGYEGWFTLPTESAKNQFVHDIKAIVDEYSFDGIDIDLEQASTTFNAGNDRDIREIKSPVLANMTDAIREIVHSYDDDFILSWAPETFMVQLGYKYYAGLNTNCDNRAGSYLPMINALREETTYVHVQLYNSQSMTGLDGKDYNMGTKEAVVAMEEMLLQGFYVGSYFGGVKDETTWFAPLRPDQVVIGVPCSTNAAGSGQIPIAQLQAAFKELNDKYPGMGGVMTWSLNWDYVQNDNAFCHQMREFLNQFSKPGTGNPGTGPDPTEPIVTDPVETDPVETDPVETDPPETDPIETDPIETDPPETDPIETDPIATDPDKTEPPVPFWKNYRDYPTANTEVYYKGKIYSNKWYANAGVTPDSGEPWVLVGDAEWTVPEDPSNYERDTSNTDINKILTDKEIDTLYGGINEDYSPEAALGRLNELMPKEYYEELFPYRFGSDSWKSTPSARSYYGDKVDTLPDYYSYENLQAAISELSDTIIKVQWFEGATWCYRLIRLNKTTKEQKLIYMDSNFESYMDTDRTMYTSVVDYGSFLAVGDLNTRKRELAGFLANISHETGGGNVDGIATEDVTGLFFNEEVGYIGSSATGYIQSSGTQYLPVAGKSYHGRGPIQLSYNFNYGLCSDVLYGDSSILLNNPEKVTEDGVLGFMTGIWFWMTPQPPKPSCHEVITGIWEPVPGASNTEFNGNFGLTIIIINNEANQSETGGAGAVVRRAKYYRMYAAKMGADITGEHCDTVGMTTFTA